MTDHINVQVELRGGLELLFSNQRSHKISLPAHVPPDSLNGAGGAQDHAVAVAESNNRPADAKYLLLWLKKHLLKEREELFLDGDTVRPGILVLINDTDWELEGEGEYILKDGDQVVLISTLHGG